MLNMTSIDIASHDDNGCLFFFLFDSIFGLLGTLRGPDDTPYAKGTFEVDIVIPDDYPFTPPKMRFITKRT